MYIYQLATLGETWQLPPRKCSITKFSC